MLVVASLPIRDLPYVVRCRYDKTPLFCQFQNILPIYRSDLVPPQPCHIRKSESLRQPWVLDLAPVKCPSIPQVRNSWHVSRIAPPILNAAVQRPSLIYKRDLRRPDAAEITDLLNRFPIPLLKTNHDPPRILIERPIILRVFIRRKNRKNNHEELNEKEDSGNRHRYSEADPAGGTP